MPRAAAGSAAAPRREKPTGRAARFAQARKNNNDLLADCERLLLREAEQPQMQNGGERRNDVIHPSELSKSGWCPRATYLRIVAARAGTIPATEPHHFQLENIFEEGHEYHRKWQDRFRRMGRLKGRWFCEACEHKWEATSPEYCPDCGAPAGAITYHEVGLRDVDHLIFGSADGEVVSLVDDEDDVLIEIKSVGEGTIRMEMPSLFAQHHHEVIGDFGKPEKILNTRAIWKDIRKPFGPHLKQGLIYLRLRNDPKVNRICFIYEFKPTSMTKAFYVERNDELIDDIWESCEDIVHALNGTDRPPSCVNRGEPCNDCKIYTDQNKEQNSDRGAAPPARAAEGLVARQRRAREEAARGAVEAPRRPAGARRSRRAD